MSFSSRNEELEIVPVTKSDKSFEVDRGLVKYVMDNCITQDRFDHGG